MCKKWHRIIIGLKSLNKSSFVESFQTGEFYWRCFENRFSPAQRHSHSCVRVKDCLYVFGGFSATFTSYNDLWLFDLNTKKWSRPTTNGSYPTPKAAASLVLYSSDKLILYGGYSHPYSNNNYNYNQQLNFYDELHCYSIKNCNWEQV